MQTLPILLLLATFARSEDPLLETKECRERERLVGSEKEDLYALVDAVEGQTLILQCRFCKEAPNDRPKNWFKVDQLGRSKPHEVQVPVFSAKPHAGFQLDMENEASRNRVAVNHKHSLIISKLSQADAGFYYCVHFEDQTNEEKFNYLSLTSLEMLKKVVEASRSRCANWNFAGKIVDWAKYQQDFFLSVNGLFKESDATEFVYLRDVLKVDAALVTQWGPWGACQACGRPQGEGLMKKRGSCRVKLSPLGSPPPNLTSNELYLLEAPAISCRSSRLLKLFPQISSYTGNIPDFLLEDRCSGACNPDAEGVNRGWKVGKGKGFKYRRHSVLEEGSHLTTVCPESTLDNKVVWKKGGRELKRGDNSDPHVIVDTFSTLYLVEVTRAVAGNFTCFVDDIRMQQLTVFVYSKSRLLTNELLRYFMYLGFILFLSSFCYCAGLVITWRRRHLFRTYQELKEEEPAGADEELESFL
ncbi:hypothetical protein HUJ05_005621 [Dendroctonus ponderosae]|nr:hypothetical protein HUJ05_005621 [Dendroctonus ponderosae]